MNPALEVEHLGLHYGGVVAIDDVSLAVPGGTISGLIGPNGAGKTSFLDAVSGFASSTTGRVRLDGQVCDGLGPHDFARAGLARTFQSLELFDDLTVEENLVVAATRPRWWSILRDVLGPGRRAAALSDAIDDAVTLCSLSALVRRMPSDLSNGERHRVALARAIVGQPVVLLLDEPGAGLDPDETGELADLLRAVANRGTAVLLVDHDMALVLGTCERVHVLDRGRLIASGTPSEVRDDRVVLDAYLGTAPAGLGSTSAGSERPDGPLGPVTGGGG